MDNISNVQKKEEQKKQFISYDEIVFICDTLSHTLKNKNFNSIYGLPRSGMVPAVILSHRLNLPIVESNGINENTLIVDDIVDSGDTMKEFVLGFKNKFRKNPYTVAIFKRENCLFEPELVGDIIKNNNWLIFPWEI